MFFCLPCSNYISKVLKRLFLAHFQAHMLASPNFNKYQSVYRAGCSTETALQLLVDRIFKSDTGKLALLVLLDSHAYPHFMPGFAKTGF